MKGKKSGSIVSRIRAEIPEGACIPKPIAKPYKVKGWRHRRNEPALVCFNPASPHPKGITETEFEKAYNQLCETGEFTRQWFQRSLSKCADEGSCNFTTIGGIFVLLDEASHSESGVYRRKLHT